MLTIETWSFWSDHKKPYSKNRKPKIFFSSLQLSLYYGQIKITRPILRMGKMLIVYLLNKKADGKNEIICLEFLISREGGPLNKFSVMIISLPHQKYFRRLLLLASSTFMFTVSYY